MQQQNIPIGTLVDMYKRGEMHLPEIQRHYVWRATRVRDLLDSLYRGYPSGSILMWETDEPIPTRDFAITQESTVFAGPEKPIDILFNLEHPEGQPTDDTDVEIEEDSLVTPNDEIADEEAEDGVQGEGTLTSQCVPTDAALWTTDRYREFLQHRRAELAQRMNAFIGEKAGL